MRCATTLTPAVGMLIRRQSQVHAAAPAAEGRSPAPPAPSRQIRRQRHCKARPRSRPHSPCSSDARAQCTQQHLLLKGDRRRPKPCRGTPGAKAKELRLALTTAVAMLTEAPTTRPPPLSLSVSQMLHGQAVLCRNDSRCSAALLHNYLRKTWRARGKREKGRERGKQRARETKERERERSISGERKN